jgi:hypothetical protein
MSKQIKIETEKSSDYENVFENYFKTDSNESDVRPIAIHHVERQKTFLWIRLYLNNEVNLQPNDTVSINYSIEQLDTKFVCYAKTGSEKDEGEFINHYNPEDDKRVLCLMVDHGDLETNSLIPTIRSLFKNTIWYRYNLLKRDELTFTHNGKVLEYYDTEF